MQALKMPAMGYNPPIILCKALAIVRATTYITTQYNALQGLLALSNAIRRKSDLNSPPLPYPTACAALLLRYSPTLPDLERKKKRTPTPDVLINSELFSPVPVTVTQPRKKRCPHQNAKNHTITSPVQPSTHSPRPI